MDRHGPNIPAIFQCSAPQLSNYAPERRAVTSIHVDRSGEMDSLRCQHSTLFAEEKSSPERAINSTTISQDVYLSGPSSPREVVQLIPCTQEALHNNDPSRDRQIGASTSTCIDEFLIDPMEDCGNPHGSPDLQPKLAGEPPPDLQDGCTSTRETQVKFIEEDEVDARPRRFLPSVGLHADTAVVQTSAVLKKQNSFDQVAAENSTLTLKGKDCSTLKHGKEKYNASPGTDWYETQNAELHVAETGQHGEWDYGPGSLQNIQMYDTNPYDSQEISKLSAGNQLLCYCEESAQHQRGMCKRFQFETAENRRMSTDCSSWTSKSAVSNAKSTVTPLDMETANVSHSESVATSSNQRVTELSSLSRSALSRLSCSPYITPETYDNQVGRSLQSVGGPIIEGPWPSGMGMHLNSIGNTASANDNVKVEIPQEDFGIQQGNLSSGITHQVSRNPGAYLVSMDLNGYNSIESVMRLDAPLPYPAAENGRENLEKDHDMLLNTCLSYGPLDMQPLKSFEQSQHIDHYVTPYNMKSPSAANADKSDRLTCRSPRKKRKKGQENEDGSRCNCKRSRCLKLYCECFAGGEYCAGTCACQECLNSVEYEDTVSDARQQIESRNPLAFAPKIIRLARELPEDIGESRHLQPAPEARHKRGCNCKKSLCLKGYCECYQAHVGCSLGCRCEGCMNTFGRKEGCGKTTKMENMTNDGGWEMSPFAGKSEAMDLAASEMGTPFQYHSHISPLTPALQGSNVNYVRQAQFPVKHHPSPDSSASLVPLYHVEPPNSPQPVGNDVLAEEREAHEGLASPDQVLRRHNAANVDPHLPRLDRSAGLSSHSDPLTMPSPSSASASASAQTTMPSPSPTSASAASQTRDSKAMQPKFIQGSWQESVGPAFRWHNPPVTPPQHFGESRFVSEPDSDDKRHHWR